MVSEEAAFLAAIHDNPEDGTLAIFADWLDDRGEAARAALARSQAKLIEKIAPGLGNLQDKERKLLLTTICWSTIGHFTPPTVSH